MGSQASGGIAGIRFVPYDSCASCLCVPIFRVYRSGLISPEMRVRRAFTALAALLLLAPPSTAQDTYQAPAPELAKLVDAPRTPRLSLSPDQRHVLLLERPGLRSIAELAEPELRLAGLRINPQNSGPSRNTSYVGMTIGSLDGTSRQELAGLPPEPRIDHVRWAPDSRHFAFTITRPDRIDLYVADVETAQARRISDAAVNDVYYGTPYDWMPDSRTLIVRTVPRDRGPAPEADPVPAGPVVQENTGAEAPARTYQDLLKNPHDKAVFEHYMTAQLELVDLDGNRVTFGAPLLVTGASPSPSGEFVLVESIHRPFSYRVPAYRFASRIEVYDREGRLVEEIADLPLQEEVPTAFGSVPTGIRSIHWRADAPGTLAWVEALDGGDARRDADERDRLYTLAAPFTDDPTPIATLRLRYAGVRWGTGQVALVSEYWWKTRQRRTYVVQPDAPESAPHVLFDYSSEDRYNHPGNPVMRPNQHGMHVLWTDEGSIFLTGEGATPEGNRPFLRKMDLTDGETEELFRSEAPYYESPALLLAADPVTLLTRRESPSEPPNYFVRNLESGETQQITDFAHPYPELADIKKEFVVYEREDGVQLTATLYLPADYDPSVDGPLPALVWAYPREFKSADAAGQVSDSPYRFKYVSYWAALPYVTQGFAVIDGASMPIIGEGDEEPNDTFVEQLVMNARAAIDMGAERGVVDPERVAIGGHSYGAFMAANLLAHSDLFRAGIARSGAYNRTLTPFGFQAEERLFWEAPEVYFATSPFMHADDIDEPLLLIHGAVDNNSGTYPMQSERLYSALKGLGKTVRLVMLPHESHGYRARESVLHMLWETNRWLNTYVRSAPTLSSETETGG